MVVHLVDTRHTDILNHPQMREIFLTESHPETRSLDCRVVFDQRLQFLVVEEIGFPWSDIRIGERLMNLQRFSLNPLSIFVVLSFLCDFSDVDFWVEVGGKSLMMVACIAIDDIQIMYLIEIMLGSISGVDARHARIESASKNGSQSGILETFFICPLPAIFKMSHITRFVVSRVEVVHSSLEACLHDGEILIWQCQIEHDIRFELIEKGDQFIHIIRIDLSSLDIWITNRFHQVITF